MVWGLKSDIHTHKFIQGAFYKNFKKMGFEAVWVDDLAKNANLVNRGDIIFAVDVASKFLPIVKGAKYVLHNISAEKIGLGENYINLQVHTSSATGEKFGIPYVRWDSSRRTLFQPWGVPTSPREWRDPKENKSKAEYWVGSIWNNDLNQGNSDFMKGYIRTLKENGIKFSQHGTPSRIHPRGISESKSMKLVNRSSIGAAVVGEWQRENNYIPCRLFKNIASGVVPSSNSDFSELFGLNEGIFDANPEMLIRKVLELKFAEKLELVAAAQSKILPYTYNAGVQRILTLLYS